MVAAVLKLVRTFVCAHHFNAGVTNQVFRILEPVLQLGVGLLLTLAWLQTITLHTRVNTAVALQAVSRYNSSLPCHYHNID